MLPGPPRGSQPTVGSQGKCRAPCQGNKDLSFTAHLLKQINEIKRQY